MGGLGLLFARWAVSQGVSRLTLVDVTRTPAHGSAADLQSPSCATEVVFLVSDVALSEDAVAGALGRVDGVMHAAGVLRDALLLKQTTSSFREVLAGKVRRGPLKARDPRITEGWQMQMNRLQCHIHIINTNHCVQCTASIPAYHINKCNAHFLMGRFQ